MVVRTFPLYPLILEKSEVWRGQVTDLKSWSSDRTGAWSHISLTPDQYYCLSWLSPTPLAILDLARNEINFYKGNFHKVTLMTVPFLEPYHSSLTHTHTHTPPAVSALFMEPEQCQHHVSLIFLSEPCILHRWGMYGWAVTVTEGRIYVCICISPLSTSGLDRPLGICWEMWRRAVKRVLGTMGARAE